MTKLADILNVRYGASQTCPKCGGDNPSGLQLPDRCVWCGPYGIDKEWKQLANKAPETERWMGFPKNILTIVVGVETMMLLNQDINKAGVKICTKCIYRLLWNYRSSS